MPKKRLIVAALLVGAAVSVHAGGEHYIIDPAHTYPSIEFSHLGISLWRGKFEKTRGSITIDRAAKTGTVDVAVETASLDWGLEAMNEYSRKAEWFDVAKFPTAVYKGTLIFDGETPNAVEGRLTLKGITRRVRLDIDLFKCIPHPLLKKELCGADAAGELHWSDFGMQKYGEGDTDKVRLRIQVEALKQD